MTHGQPILRLERVAKRFGGMTAIDDLSFDVKRGSRTALIGPNGAGKTTVFNIVTGAVPIDAGRVFVDGVDISRVASRRRIAHGVARSFQNVRLMPHLTTLENVMVGQHCRNAGLFGVLQPVNLWPRNRWRDTAHAALTEREPNGDFVRVREQHLDRTARGWRGSAPDELRRTAPGPRSTDRDRAERVTVRLAPGAGGWGGASAHQCGRAVDSHWPTLRNCGEVALTRGPARPYRLHQPGGADIGTSGCDCIKAHVS